MLQYLWSNELAHTHSLYEDHNRCAGDEYEANRDELGGRETMTANRYCLLPMYALTSLKHARKSCVCRLPPGGTG